ncbi:DUF2975 domain-containing protein [Chryseolinea lacunae]|uniref:DUF2975 domain-containing protein n=1 Tax=Chryseolinea lacunae TaxID=2801331 RepID=A0ABS1L1V6_9BACT|nr:DUF2975 domain-containing protein [Chryseolinea lacunae]MBL0745508.1 DUF2975 domain-containing protein [Chryseolinea lacunae]
MKTKSRTEHILTALYVLAWIAFVGFLVEAGALLLSYVISCINPDGAKNLYKGFNLNSDRNMSLWYNTMSVSFLIALAVMKAYVWYYVIRILSKINMVNPFTTDVAQMLERISHLLLSAWIVAMLSGAQAHWLSKTTGDDYHGVPSGDFLFMAALVFVISQVFKRGVEIQSENDLTI